MVEFTLTMFIFTSLFFGLLKPRRSDIQGNVNNITYFLNKILEEAKFI